MPRRAALLVTTLALLIPSAQAAAAATVELISQADPFPDSNGRGGQPALSADGRYAAFFSEAPNLAPRQVDDNFFLDVFLHDRVTDTTTLVSHAAGAPNRAGHVEPDAINQSLDLQISADGRYVAFSSLGTDLVPGVTDTNSDPDVFLWDRVTGTTTLVSHAAGSPNLPVNGGGRGIQLSADGRYLAFTSQARDLVAGQTEPEARSSSDVFLWDRASNASTLVSRKSGTNATGAGGDSVTAGISADGDVVLFTSTASDLLPIVSDTPGSTDVFLYQRSSGTVSLVSRVSGAPETAAGGSLPVLSADGRYVAFLSRALNLVPGQVDENSVNSLDAFLFDRLSGEMRLTSHTSTSPQVAGGRIGIGVTRISGVLAISGDGRYVAFVSQAMNLVPGQVDTVENDDVFVYNRVTGTTALASHVPGSAVTATTGSAGSRWPTFSADGRFLAFASAATGLVSNQTDANAEDDVFLYDTSTQATALVSRSGSSAFTTANADSTFPLISADGGIVGFISKAADLGEGQVDPNHFYDPFLYHRTSGEITSPSRRDPRLPAVTPHGPSVVEGISADGRYTVFSSRAAGLVPGQIDVPDGFDIFLGQPTGTWDVFLRDQTAGRTTLLSRSPTSKVTAVGGTSPVLSADGRVAALVAFQANPGGNQIERLYLYNRVADTLTLVNHKPGLATAPEGFLSFGMSISADGRFLAYGCTACGLVPGHSAIQNGVPAVDVFLYDRTTGTNTLVSHVPGSTATGGNGPSQYAKISADGRFVVFSSEAGNLVPGQNDTSHPSPDLFVFDRTTGAVALVTRTAASATTAIGSTVQAFGLNADGRFIAFVSGGTGLFLYDRVARTTVLVNHAVSLPATLGNGPLVSLLWPGETIFLSADGRFLVYDSQATDLVARVTDLDSASDAFLYDRLSGTNTLLSSAGGAPGRTASQGAIAPRISADGGRVTLLSASTDLIPGQFFPSDRVRLFVRNRSAGPPVLVGGVNGLSGLPPELALQHQFSADGRRVAFTSGTPFVQGDLNGDLDVYLWKDDSGPISLPACTLLDTRRRADRPVLTSNVQRAVTVRGACGVPATARQVVIKVTVFNPSGKGNLRLYPGAVAGNPSAILRFERGATRTETFTLPLGTDGKLTILPFVAARGTVHGAVEVSGYSE